MKIALQDAPAVLVDYMEKHILPKASGWQKFGVGAAMFALGNRATALVNDPKLASSLKAIGIMGDDGFVDVDYAREMALSAMQKAGGSLPTMGYVLDASDIEAIYETAKNVKTG